MGIPEVHAGKSGRVTEFPTRDAAADAFERAGLRQNLRQHVARHIGQAIAPAVVHLGPPLVGDAERVEHRRVQIVPSDGIARGAVADFVGFAVA
jgi:hypothetical protein